MEKKALKFVEKLSKRAVEFNTVPENASEALRNALATLPDGSLKAELLKNIQSYTDKFSQALHMHQKAILRLCTEQGISRAEPHVVAMLPCSAPDMYFSLQSNGTASDYLSTLETLTACLKQDSTTGGYCSLYLDQQSVLPKTAYYMNQLSNLIESSLPLPSNAVAPTVRLVLSILSLCHARGDKSVDSPASGFSIPSHLEYDSVSETRKLLALLIVLAQSIGKKGVSLAPVNASDDTDDESDEETEFTAGQIICNLKFHCEMGRKAQEMMAILLEYERLQHKSSFVSELYQYALQHLKIQRIESEQEYLNQILFLRLAEKHTKAAVAIQDFIRLNPALPSRLDSSFETYRCTKDLFKAPDNSIFQNAMEDGTHESLFFTDKTGECNDSKKRRLC